jgi:hypothetical protein
MDSELFKIRIAEIKNADSPEEQRSLIRALYFDVNGELPEEEDLDFFASQYKVRKNKKHDTNGKAEC